MDFGSVRKKLARGVYKSLEQFEKDVFLISSNAMRYNSPDTIYFRQARSIHELAKKSFDNLRQESDDNEPEPKVVRRGRPPGTGKNSIKRPVGRPPAELTRSEFSSEASLANAVNGNLSSNLRNDLLRKVSGMDKYGKPDVSAKNTQFFRSSEAYNVSSEQRSERNDDYSVSKGFSKYGKKLSEVDENRRNTYKQDQMSSSMLELPMLTALDAEKKFLVPVGLHVENAYARSLARFAANLGPVGWEIAAKRIEKVLPPGTKFGPGWVGESETPHPSQSKVSTVSRGEEFPDPHSSTSLPHDNSHDCSEAKALHQIHQNIAMHAPANGFKVPLGPPNLLRPIKPAAIDAAGKFVSESPATAQAVANNTMSGSSLNHRWTATSGLVANEGTPSLSSCEGQRPTWNARFQSSGSSIPGAAADPQAQKPDLALQL
ncbi:hypothetical protein AXF42_Ash015493 [Apostasia shenzhenica]|uniref:Bromo domain-containing protein n=1 Tax=Apostasia shenzhenica TaxID=1088818 RepID=A0A2H9ZSD4_9ASPA|nr:hypothetical protein AXF42_Ash015493 [Apostasia shenzhenica]